MSRAVRCAQRAGVGALIFLFVAACSGGGGGDGRNNANANLPPVIGTIAAETPQGTAVSIDIAAQANDPDGAIDASSIALATPPASGQVGINADGTVSYLPDEGFARSDAFSVTIRDNLGARSAPAVVSVDVVPRQVAKNVDGNGGSWTAADGKTTVTVPAGAVGGMTNFTMVQQTGSDIPAELQVDGVVAVYDMQPDGSRFAQPLDIEVLLDVDSAGGLSPLVLLSQDANGIELLSGLETEVQEQGTVVRGKLSHFSRLIVFRLPPVLVFTDAVRAAIGENFTAGYTVVASNIADATRVYTGRVGLYQDAPLSFERQFGFGNPVLGLDTPLADLAYLEDVDFTTPGESRDTGTVFGRCARFGEATVNLEIYGEGTLTVLINSRIPNVRNLPALNQPTLLSRVSIPVSCLLDGNPMSGPPVAADDTATAVSGQAVSIDVVANDSDPDNDLDPLSATVLSQPANGTVSVSADGSGQLVYTSAAGFEGTDVFQYFVRDIPGQPSNSATVTVTVQGGNAGGLPPVAADDSVTAQVNSAVTIDVTANDTDPDGDLDPTSTTLRIGPASGSAVVNANGTVTYTPNPAFTGTDSFTYFVLDAEGSASNDATVTISVQTPTNQPPVANDDSDFTPQNTPLLSEVADNDTDDGRIVALNIVSGPANGTVQDPPVGDRIFYTPNRGYSGTDSIVYTAVDDQGEVSNPATLTITVGIVAGGNTPPLVQDDAVSTPQDTPVTFDVLANDTDIDGQIDAASIVLSTNTTVRFGALAANADNTFTYTPDPGYVGTDRFAYTVADDAGDRSAEAQVVISVTGTGSPPIANPDVADTLVNQPVDIFVATNDDGSGFLLDIDTIRVESPPANGTAVRRGSGITYTPDQNFTGVDTFTYSIANAALLRSAPAQVTVTVNQPTNEPPVANDDMASTVPDRPVTIAVTANDRDSDGRIDPATVAITMQPTMGSVTVAANGDVTYTPGAGFAGTDQFRYTVNDDGGETSNAATVTVNVSRFLGSDLNPVDNISAAELQFLVRFAGRFVSQGIGGFFGLNHASADSIANLEQIGDYTWLFGLQDSDQAPNDPFLFDTELQSGTASYNGVRYEVTGFAPLPVFNATGGRFTVTSSADATITDSIGPPNAPLLDSNAQPLFVRGQYDGLATVVQFPDAEFTHMLVRFLFVPRNPTIIAPIGLIARIPKDAMQLDANGMRFREIVDATARAELARRGLAPVSGVAVVFYNQAENTTVFPDGGGNTFRPVPIAAGKGFSIPAHQLVGPPARCETVPVNVRCQGGPNNQLLVTNGNGDISAHSPDDGSLLRFLIGGNSQPPNFTVGRGEQTVQDPATNCLLVTDSREPTTREGVIHLYDTDGTLLQANFITRASGPGDPLLTPRGMAFFDGDLYVATEGDGRVLRFDAVSGAFIDERVNDPTIAPRDIEFLPNGDLLLTDAAPSGTGDRVLLYPADGTAPRVIVNGGLGSPYQLSTTNDLNFALANFSLGQVRFFNDGTPQLLDVTLGQDSQARNIRPFGVYPLTNGNYLVTSDRAGISVLDITDPANGLVGEPIVRGSGKYIAPACMP